jgi:hypothetical protein
MSKNEEVTVETVKGMAVEGETKISKVRRMFAMKDKWSRSEIADVAGYDMNNAAMAMAILKNGSRTKRMLVTTYNRETKVYTLVKD